MAEPREPVPTSNEPLAILSATPKKPDSGEIQNDLSQLGLSCSQASLENIRQYIEDVESQLPDNRQGFETFLIGKRDRELRGALSRPALEFVLYAPKLSQQALREATDELSGHPGCGDFLEHLLTENPGGAHFVSAMTGIAHDAPDLLTRLPAEYPNTVRLLTLLAQHDVVPSSTGTWVPDQSEQYIGLLMDNLAEVLNHARFDCLRGMPEKEDKQDTRRGEQPGAHWGTYKYQQLDRFNWDAPTAQIIKDSYVGLASNATAFLDLGIESRNLVSVLSNKISGIQDSQLADYHPGPQELLVFLVKDPLMEQGKPSVDGAGALSVTWDIYVGEYKKKKRTYKSGWMDVWLRSVLFTSYYETNGVRLQEQMSDDADLCP
ncbi:hypothetical protein [Streptomyces buecherae]|uniref:Uncharacterized protein n=1 Tax=Streptomyces buecherae TaxID=2763006 RepID=A0A7H8NEK4_9ACTN|nr:hypothetical protein [Streptomyces buecherae]QKW52138.1 hypothetical protein HUT08_24295 [Streptomyces buecherae]